MQKVAQKKLLEKLIKDKNYKKQKFICIFKKIFEKYKKYFNIKNIKENNNYKYKTERSILIKEFRKSNNTNNKKFNNQYDNYYNNNYNNSNCHKTKTPKIKKDIKNYRMNYLTTNRFLESKYTNFFSPNKSINKKGININKINGSYFTTKEYNINSPYNN